MAEPESNITVGEARKDGSLGKEILSSLSDISVKTDLTNENQKTQITLLGEMKGFIKDLTELIEGSTPTPSQIKEEENEKKRARLASGTRKPDKREGGIGLGGIFGGLGASLAGIKGLLNTILSPSGYVGILAGALAAATVPLSKLAKVIGAGFLKVGLITAVAGAGYLTGEFLYNQFFKSHMDAYYEQKRIRDQEQSNRINQTKTVPTQVSGEDAFADSENKAIPRSEMEKRVEQGESPENFSPLSAKQNVVTGEIIQGRSKVEPGQVVVNPKTKPPPPLPDNFRGRVYASEIFDRPGMDFYLFEARFAVHERKIAQFLKYYPNEDLAKQAERDAFAAAKAAYLNIQSAKSENKDDPETLKLIRNTLLKFPILDTLSNSGPVLMTSSFNGRKILDNLIDSDSVMDGQTLYFKTLNGWRSRGTPAELAGYPELEKPMVSRTAFKTGGLVTKPTRALIGEAGAELVLPLQQAATFIASVLTSMVNTGAPILANAKSGRLAADMMTNSSLSSGGSANIISVNNSSNPTMNTSNSLSIGGSGTSPNMNNISYLRTKSRRSNSEMF